MREQERREKTILKISLATGVAFAVVELFMALYSRSQSILMDAALDGSELIVIAASLLLTPLLYRPITEKRPFGYAQCESLFIIVRGFMMTAVTVSLIASSIQMMMTGGNHVNHRQVSAFEFALSALSLLVFLVMRHLAQKPHSPMIAAELAGWRIDVVCGLGVSAAFLLPSALADTALAWISPYFDQMVAVALAALMLPEPVRMIAKALHDILLFAPAGDVMERLRAVCVPACAAFGWEIVFLDAVQTGRKLWIGITLKGPGEVWDIRKLRRLNEALTENLRRAFEDADVDVELIPSLEDTPQPGQV